MFFKKNKEYNSDALKHVVSALKKTEIRIQAVHGKVAADASKIGGMPFLPSEFEWPYFEGTNYEGNSKKRPLAFLCQINLNDVKQLDSEHQLPAEGMLYFFYEVETQCWGFDSSDKGCSRVYYYNPNGNFQPLALPADMPEEGVIPEIKLSFCAKDSYPSWEELEYHATVDSDWEEYDELLETLGFEQDSERHKLLGYADLIQSEMLTECERTERGLSCGNPAAYAETPEEIQREIEQAASDWVLLLQLNTIESDDYEMMWGDCGNLYFYIKKQDLQQKKFENVWLVLQCG